MSSSKILPRRHLTVQLPSWCEEAWLLINLHLETSGAGKGLVSKMYEELLKIDSKKTNNLCREWTKDLNKDLRKEDNILMDNKYIR